VQLWDVSTGKVEVSLPAFPPKATPSAVAFSADGKTVAVGCTNGDTYVFSLSGAG
jgi:WD40 repeat protein